MPRSLTNNYANKNKRIIISLRDRHGNLIRKEFRGFSDNSIKNKLRFLIYTYLKLDVNNIRGEGTELTDEDKEEIITDVENKDPFGLTPLSLAKNKEIIKLLINAGADVNNKDSFGGTPLIYAENREIIKLLINAGAEVNYAPENGITSLAKAVLREDKESAKLLISSGANVNSIDREGSTPLNTAIFCIEMLKEDEETGLNDNDIAASRVTLSEIIKLLRKHGGKMAAELQTAGN